MKRDFCDDIPNIILVKFGSGGKVFSDVMICLYIGQSISRIACGGHAFCLIKMKRGFFIPDIILECWVNKTG
jgi:hypothetical protein